MIIKEVVKKVCVDGFDYDIDKVEIEIDEVISTQGTSLSANIRDLEDHMICKGIPVGIMTVHTEEHVYFPSVSSTGMTKWKRL